MANHIIQGIPILNIAKVFGTPLFVYDSDAINYSFRTLRNIYTEKTDIFYSIKANPNIALCSLFINLGGGAEVSSLTELEIALKAGFLPKNIIFVGPAKKEIEIQKSIEHDIYVIVCESLNELARINQIAKRLKKTARVALRINPNFIVKSAPLKMGGVASQFGIDEDILISSIKKIDKFQDIKVIGVHVYNGTRILDIQSISDNTKNILYLFNRIAHHLKMKFEMIDIGGGLGINYHENENELDASQLAHLLIPTINTFSSAHPDIRIITESGRFLVGKSGYFVTKIVDIKHSKSENYIIVDGGTNCHMAAIGVGSIYKRNFPISLIKNKNPYSPHKIKYQITGPLCTPGDQLGKNIDLNQADIDDLIVIHNSGAYGPTASPVLFLGHGFPAEVLVHEGKAHLIRKRDDFHDMVRNQISIPIK